MSKPPSLKDFVDAAALVIIVLVVFVGLVFASLQDWIALRGSPYKQSKKEHLLFRRTK